MAIVQNYAAIAAELRRLQSERGRREESADRPVEQVRPAPATRHPMRATPAGERLYRRLISRGRG